MLLAIFFQAYYANQSLKVGLPNNIFGIYLKYFYSKIFYVTTNLLENTFKLPISCTLNITSREYCSSNNIIESSILSLLWFLLEAYFTYIVYVFYKKNFEEDINLRQGINLQGWPILIQEMLTVAIPIEVEGFKIGDRTKFLDDMEEDITNSIQNSIILSEKHLKYDKVNLDEEIILVIFRYFE